MSEIELTEEDYKAAAAFIDPDEQASDQYGWDQNYQREILGLLVHDRAFVLENIGLIKPSYFVNEAHQKICSIVFNYFDRYKNVPNRTQIIQELKDQLSEKKEDVKTYFLGELDAVISYFVPGLESRDYYRDEIMSFAKRQALKTAISKVMDMLKETKKEKEEETWDDIGEVLRDALLVQRNFEPGDSYFENYEDRYKRMEEELQHKEVFTSGFDLIDNGLQGGGLHRGEMASWMGLSGVGKSLALVTATIANILRGKRVLYITLELSADRTAQRFDAQLGDPANLFGLTVNNLLEKKEVVFNSLKEWGLDKEDKRMLIIKQFPGGSMDVNDFKAYYSQMKLRGFVPDMVVIDYIGEMKDYPGIATHESRYRITRDLRGFAVEENIFILTAMQPNKSAKTATREGLLIDDENIGDSFSQIKPLDAFWSLNQTNEERECGLVRLWIVKHRNGKSRYLVFAKINYDNLSIKQISQHEYEETLRKYRQNKEKTTADALKDKMQDEKLKEIWSKKKQQKNGNSNGDAPLQGLVNGKDEPVEDVPEPPPAPELPK